MAHQYLHEEVVGLHRRGMSICTRLKRDHLGKFMSVAIKRSPGPFGRTLSKTLGYAMISALYTHVNSRLNLYLRQTTQPLVVCIEKSICISPHYSFADKYTMVETLASTAGVAGTNRPNQTSVYLSSNLIPVVDNLYVQRNIEH